MNTYILLDSFDKVVNIIAMPDEPVNQELINSLVSSNSGNRFIKISNDQDDISSVECVKPVNVPLIGSTWDGIGFLASSPGPEFMLDHTGYDWIPIPPDVSQPGVYEWDSENLSWTEQ